MDAASTAQLWTNTSPGVVDAFTFSFKQFLPRLHYVCLLMRPRNLKTITDRTHRETFDSSLSSCIVPPRKGLRHTECVFHITVSQQVSTSAERIFVCARSQGTDGEWRGKCNQQESIRVVSATLGAVHFVPRVLLSLRLKTRARCSRR